MKKKWYMSPFISILVVLVAMADEDDQRFYKCYGSMKNHCDIFYEAKSTMSLMCRIIPHYIFYGLFSLMERHCGIFYLADILHPEIRQYICQLCLSEFETDTVFDYENFPMFNRLDPIINFNEVKSWFDAKLFGESGAKFNWVYNWLYHWFAFDNDSWRRRNVDYTINQTLMFLVELKKAGAFYVGFDNYITSDKLLDNEPNCTWFIHLSKTTAYNITITMKTTYGAFVYSDIYFVMVCGLIIEHARSKQILIKKTFDDLVKNYWRFDHNQWSDLIEGEYKPLVCEPDVITYAE